jgi:hypothetical protein
MVIADYLQLTSVDGYLELFHLRDLKEKKREGKEKEGKGKEDEARQRKGREGKERERKEKEREFIYFKMMI